MFDGFAVGFFVRRKDEKVTHIDDEPSFIDHFSEGVIHKSLERRQGVGEYKEHDGDFFLGNKERTLTRMLSRQLLLPPWVGHYKLGKHNLLGETVPVALGLSR